MKRHLNNTIKLILILTMCIVAVFTLCACNDDKTENNPPVTPPPVVEPLPTASEIITARQAVATSTQQNYDFKLNLAGTLAVAEFNGAANANYDGKYRYNATSGNLKFRRETSGILLYDSVEYIYTSGTSKIKLHVDDKNAVKKASVVTSDEEGLSLVNIPFVAIVDSLTAANINEIKKSDRSAYKYMATLALNSENASVQAVINKLSGMGTSLDLNGIKFTNIANGVKFYFNLQSGRLTNFTMSADLAFPVKGVDVAIKLTYAQNENNADITIPSTANIITDKSGIASEMNTINAAIEALKSSETYSLDLEARNEFDPGWNVRAIVDKYIARMYKTVNDGRVDFNHSYEYKAHTEEEGAETFKYTLGNLQDGSVHKVSRKGTNSIEEVNGITADTQFDFLLNATKISADKIDCIRKISSGGSTKYYVYMNSEQTMSVQSAIAELINSNNAEGVLPVDNYFNNNRHLIRDAEMIIEMQNGKIVAIDVSTKIRYNPVGGDYMEEQITLTDSISLKINDKLDNAKDYKAPKNTETKLGSFGLNNAKFYIL